MSYLQEIVREIGANDLGLEAACAEVDRLRATLREIDDDLEGYVDGAPDAPAFSRKANYICTLIRISLQPTRSNRVVIGAPLQS